MSLCQSCHDSDKFVHTNLSIIEAIKGLALLSIFLFGSRGFAKAPTEAEFSAATMTAEEVGVFIDKLPNKPSNVAIFNVKSNPPLDPNFSDALEGEVIRVLKDLKSISLMSCLDCRAPKLEVRNDKLVIRKGIPDHAALKDLAKDLGVDSFLFLEVYRTRFTLVTQVTLRQASDGEVLGSQQIKVPALDWSDADMLVLFSAGPSSIGGGISVNDKTNTFHWGSHLAILEEIGFGKAGLVMGATSGPKGTLSYLTPTLGWRGRFSSYGLYSLKTIGAGYGLSDQVGGVALRASYNLMMGTFTMMGADIVGLAPVQKAADRNPMNYAITLYIGFTLGR